MQNADTEGVTTPFFNITDPDIVKINRLMVYVAQQTQPFVGEFRY